MQSTDIVGRWILQKDVAIEITINDQRPDGTFSGTFYFDRQFKGTVNGSVSGNTFRMLMHWSVFVFNGRRELTGQLTAVGSHVGRISGHWSGNKGLGMSSGSFVMSRTDQ